MAANGDSRAVRDHPPGRDRRGRRVADDDRGNPAVQARRLRAALRRARQNAGLTLEQVATEMDSSPSKIVRVESGAVRVSTPDLKAMLDLYKITDPDRRAEFVSMARAARQPPWWRDYGEFAAKRYLEYVELEQAAVATVNFQPQFVPGLLQTQDYASAITRRLSWDITEDRANGLVEFRMQRQKRLLDTPSPRGCRLFSTSRWYSGRSEAQRQWGSRSAIISRWPGGPTSPFVSSVSQLGLSPGCKRRLRSFSSRTGPTRTRCSWRVLVVTRWSPRPRRGQPISPCVRRTGAVVAVRHRLGQVPRGTGTRTPVGGTARKWHFLCLGCSIRGCGHQPAVAVHRALPYNRASSSRVRGARH